MDSHDKLERAMSIILGDRLECLVSLKGPGWAVQTGISDGNKNQMRLIELPNEGGATQFLNDCWNYVVYGSEEEARAANPEFPEGVYEIHQQGRP